MPVSHDVQDLTIAVVGATGQQGGATARQLLSRGARVRALTRDPGSAAATALGALGADVVAAVPSEVESLTAALVGADRLFAMTTPQDGVEDEVAQGFTIAAAAEAAGIQHVVYSSVGGAERHTGIPHFDSKREVELRLAELGLATTLVRPVFFMENLLSSSAVEDGTVVVRLPFPDEISLQLVAVDDIAAVATAALLDPSTVPAALEIAGDELTGGQIAAQIGAYTGLPARYEALPLEVLAGNEDMTAMFAWFTRPRDGQRAYDADLVATRSIAPGVKTLAAWLPTSGLSTSR